MLYCELTQSSCKNILSITLRSLPLLSPKSKQTFTSLTIASFVFNCPKQPENCTLADVKATWIVDTQNI